MKLSQFLRRVRTETEFFWLLVDFFLLVLVRFLHDGFDCRMSLSSLSYFELSSLLKILLHQVLLCCIQVKASVKIFTMSLGLLSPRPPEPYFCRHFSKLPRYRFENEGPILCNVRKMVFLQIRANITRSQHHNSATTIDNKTVCARECRRTSGCLCNYLPPCCFTLYLRSRLIYFILDVR